MGDEEGGEGAGGGRHWADAGAEDEDLEGEAALWQDWALPLHSRYILLHLRARTSD